MLVVLLEFLVLAVVVALAGTFLAKSADQIAEITRLGRLLIGSVLLAAATSLPELTVDLTAVRQGMPDLAVGDLFGSSLMNLLILASLRNVGGTQHFFGDPVRSGNQIAIQLRFCSR